MASGVDTDLLFYLGITFLLIVGVTILLPNNPVTGNVALETDSCGKLGCSQLCDTSEDCGIGATCCPTAWAEGGLCDYAENCPVIAEFSARGGTLEEYTLARGESPQAIRNIGFRTFWLPMLVVAAVCIAVIMGARKKPL